MRKILIAFNTLLVCVTLQAKPKNLLPEKTDRDYWVNTMITIVDPVLVNLSQNTLRKNMPVEVNPDIVPGKQYENTHLEALGRTMAGIAPWLELGPDDTPEGKLRQQYIELSVKAISNGADPKSPDFLNFTKNKQPLVDAAFLAHGLLRAPKHLWGNLSKEAQENVINALRETRKIVPNETNWLLFSAVVEAALKEFTGEWNYATVKYAFDKFTEWYKGDGWYGDGPDFHMDYYNSYVIHPMLLDALKTAVKTHPEVTDFYTLEQARFTRYAGQQERLISPTGAYPVVGRSIPYRFGAFQVLAQASLEKQLPVDVLPAQVRSALTAVIKKQLSCPGTFDQNGWLQMGFCGHQPTIAERYLSTGSAYLCSVVFLPLGLSANDEFWTAPAADWTGKKAWSGQAIKADKMLKP